MVVEEATFASMGGSAVSAKSVEDLGSNACQHGRRGQAVRARSVGNPLRHYILKLNNDECSRGMFSSFELNVDHDAT